MPFEFFAAPAHSRCAALRPLSQLFVLAIAPIVAHAGISVTLKTSLPSSQLVGTPITLAAYASGAGGKVAYRFAVLPSGSSWSVLRDYSQSSTVSWTTLGEGSYTLAVEAIDSSTGQTAQASAPFQLTSRVTNGTPVISPTAHPLIALYSAPPCSAGYVQVYFEPQAGGQLMTTPQIPCQGAASINFYLAGMYANTAYYVEQQWVNGSSLVHGPLLSFQTGALPPGLPQITAGFRPNASTSNNDKVILVSDYTLGNVSTVPFATDLSGQVLWYLPPIPDASYVSLVRPTSSGSLIILPGPDANGNMAISQLLQEVDVAGNLIHETNVGRINTQLKARGQSPVNWLSHEGLRLPNGHTLTFGSVERILSNIQGLGPVDVVGDMILDLDQNFQVAWTWNAFDFLDARRKATLGDTCTSNYDCGPLYLAPSANDWTHGNSIRYIPSDGSLVVSERNQDWILKLDYQNGSGTGKVLWTLGKDADFTTSSNDPWPWFSHQHDFEFDGSNFEVYDNGNTHFVSNHYSGHSRGQVWAINEAARTATLLLNADMGVLSPVSGTAQKLSNGNYQFLNGNLSWNGMPASEPLEVTPQGTQNLSFLYNVWAYRVFRMKDLYSYAP